MQSRRPQDYLTMSTPSKMRNQHGRSETVKDMSVISFRDASDRSRRSLSPHKLDGSRRFPNAHKTSDSADRRDYGFHLGGESSESLSPHKLDGSRRFLDAHKTSDSTDRKDYGFHLGGERSERVLSKSPQYGLLHKRDHFENGVVRRKYVYHEDVEFDLGKNSRYVYGYDHGTTRASKEQDYSQNRMLNNKSMPMEVDTIRGSYRLPQDVGPTKNFDEPSGSLPSSSSGGMDVNRVEHERLQYPEPIPSDELAAMESYKEEEKPVNHSRDKLPVMEGYGEEEKPVYHSRDKLPLMEGYREEEKPVYHSRDKLPLREGYREEEKPVYHSRDKLPLMEGYRGEKPRHHSRDILYKTVPASHSKDVLSDSQYKNYVSTSSGASVSEFPVSYRDGLTLPASDGYLKNNIQLTEPIGSSTYGQRSYVDNMRDAEAAPRNLIYNQHGAYSPSRTEHEDYVYPKTRVMSSDDQGYPSDNMHRMMSPRIRHDYDHALMDYEYDERDLPRPSNRLPVVDRIDNTEVHCGDLRNSSVLDHPSLQNQTVSDYPGMSRKSYALKQGPEYLNFGSTHAELERDVPRDYGVSCLDVSQDHQMSYLRSDYGYRRDAGQDVHKERFQNSSDPVYDSEMKNVDLNTNRIEEELAMHEPSEKVLKRKNGMDDDINRHDVRTIMSSKWHIPEKFEDLYDNDECFEEEMSGVHLSKTRRVNHNEYTKGGRTYDGRERYGNFASGDWFSSRDTLVHSQRSVVRFYKNSGRYIKGNARPGFLSRHNSYHADRRSGLHKQHKVWKRIEEYNEDVHENDGHTSEEWSNLAKCEPSEDSEEFKELVHKAFLVYCKKVNVNPSIRRRYKEQGKAGSLFCIVCGQSLSKEFMNTQSLVRHAFMSHKVGLRAYHLGLQKAICVLMEWNTVVPYDMITWVPEVLPDVEAMAQKEDLILWPPIVIIRNISMSNNNPKEQKVIPIEGVEAFLRGKGFVGGKITVCLGRPADQSVVAVKFLGTFTGLESAEKLHKYFVERKHGRTEFVHLTSNHSRSSSVEFGIPGDKLEEQLLYGYMGISEDLDSVDFNSKKYCLIKSKKEILDLANTPVKSDDR